MPSSEVATSLSGGSSYCTDMSALRLSCTRSIEVASDASSGAIVYSPRQLNFDPNP